MHIALIGASPRPDSLSLKLQHRITSREINYTPITPKCPEINGIITSPDLNSLEQIPDLVVFMVNPKITLGILDQVSKKKIKKVWFQPGSFNDKVIQKATQLGLKINTELCMLVAPLSAIQEFVNT